MDPSHACFLHDGVAGKWEDAAPLTMHLKHNKIDVNQVGLPLGIADVTVVTVDGGRCGLVCVLWLLLSHSIISLSV